MPVTSFLYFAYGSNMLTRRLRARTPGASPVCTGYVEGRCIKYHKISIDGSGKCDIPTTGLKADRVYGVLYQIPLAEKSALDKTEGLGLGYQQENLTVYRSDSFTCRAMAYIATAVDPTILPYHWYKSLVLKGAREHGLPKEYVTRIGQINSQVDTDHQRSRKHDILLR
jgi:hypothetical protein